MVLLFRSWHVLSAVPDDSDRTDFSGPTVIRSCTVADELQSLACCVRLIASRKRKGTNSATAARAASTLVLVYAVPKAKCALTARRPSLAPCSSHFIVHCTRCDSLAQIYRSKGRGAFRNPLGAAPQNTSLTSNVAPMSKALIRLARNASRAPAARSSLATPIPFFGRVIRPYPSYRAGYPSYFRICKENGETPPPPPPPQQQQQQQQQTSRRQKSCRRRRRRGRLRLPVPRRRPRPVPDRTG